MVELIGRDEDLRLLDDTYKVRKFKCCAIIGRRRIGKSALIEKFVEDKDNIYFEFLEGLPEINLRYMENVIGRYKGVKVSYRDFMDAFDDLSAIAKEKKVTIVFDEFTYAMSYNAFPALTKNLIDRGLGDSYLIISGSLVRMLEAEINDYSKPLFGRVRIIRLNRIGLTESRAFHPKMSELDLLKLHIISGGSPYYLSETPANSLEEYFERYIIPVRSPFHDEGEQILIRELKEPELYKPILDALASGKNDVKLISDFAKIDGTTCRSHISKLLDAGIISEIKPMYDSPKKPVRYRFEDAMVALHFRVFRKLSFGPLSRYKTYTNAIETELGRLFEPYCMRFISENYGILSIGSWFRTILIEKGEESENDADSRRIKGSVEIDIVSDISDGRNRIELFTECKLTKERTGMHELNELDRKLTHVHGKKNYRRMLISTGGFDPKLADMAETENIMLIDIDCIFGHKALPQP